MKIILVEWVDARTDGGWRPNEPDLTLADCVTIGLLQFDLPDRVIITQSRSSTGNRADRIAIPKGCIKRIRELNIRRTPSR